MPRPAAHYVILGLSPVIAEDLAQAILVAHPHAGSRIHRAADAADLLLIMGALAVEDHIAVAFVSMNDAAARAALLPLVEILPGRVVLLGDEAEEDPSLRGQFDVLVRPFSDADVRKFLPARPAGCRGKYQGDLR